MPNPHWHGALLSDRCWYAVGWLMGLGIALGLLLLIDYLNFQRWLSATGGGESMLRSGFRRFYGRRVAISR